MESAAFALFAAALEAAVVIALPLVLVVAATGVIVGVVQTIVQVQDQNVAFAPKLAIVALLVAIAGPDALALTRSLLVQAVSALPAIAR